MPSVCPARAGVPPTGLSDAVQMVMPTVVNITSRSLIEPVKDTMDVEGAAAASGDASSEQRVRTLLGSGFVIDPDGLIVTNNHVVEDSFNISIAFQDGTVTHADLVATTKTADIALLQVHLNRKLPSAHFANDTLLRVGDPVFAIGNPLGFGGSVSFGIVSALNRDAMVTPGDSFIQTDASINHGNSGGPLFDLQGEVVGINTAIFTPNQTSGSIGIGFAIPATLAVFIVDQLRHFGIVRYGDVGLEVQDVNADLAVAAGIPESFHKVGLLPGSAGFGVIVSKVIPSGSAAAAGVETGDVVLLIDGKPISDSRAFFRLVTHRPLGTPATLSIWRGRQAIEVSVIVQPLLSAEKADLAALKRASASREIDTDLGLKLISLSAELRAKYHLPDQSDGVLVTHVEPNSIAGDRGLAAGDLVMKIMETPTRTPDDIFTNLRELFKQHQQMVMMLVERSSGARWVAIPLVDFPTSNSPN